MRRFERVSGVSKQVRRERERKMRPFDITRASQKRMTISVAGNIGAGKSTLIKQIQQRVSPACLQVLPEPVEQWTNLEGHNVLQAFYTEPSRYAYLFQTLAFTSRCIGLTEAPRSTPLRITERSPLSDRVFMLNLLESGNLSQMEWAVYRSFYDYMIQKLEGMPDIILYLRTRPEQCMERIRSRGREEESAITMDYLQRLHEKHEAWMPEQEGGVTDEGHTYFCVDGSVDFRIDEAFLSKVVIQLFTLCGLPLVECPPPQLQRVLEGSSTGAPDEGALFRGLRRLPVVHG